MVGRENDGKATTEEALAYIHAVHTFQNEPGKYEEFLEVLKNFSASRISTNGVVTRLKEVFKDHEELILGLATFLPSGCNIPNVEREEKKHVTFKDALSLVNKIRIRFQGDNDHVYKSFLDNLQMFRNGSKSVTDVCHEIGILFKDHPDLLVEFHCFLPASTQTIIRDQGIVMLFQSLNI